MPPKQATMKSKSFGRKNKGRAAQLAAARAKKSSSHGETASAEDTRPTPSRLVGPVAATPVMSDSPVEVVVSASKRKLAYNQSQTTTTPPETTLPCTIVQLDMLQQLFSALLCPECHQLKVVLKSDSTITVGLVVHLKAFCINCDTDISSAATSKKASNNNRVYELNRGVVASAMATGMGFAAVQNFFEPLNIPFQDAKSFSSHVKAIHEQSAVFSDAMLKKAADKVKTLYEPEEDGIYNIHTTYDGSWQKRGFTSKVGLGCVIERKTGLAVDFAVMSSYCAACATTGERLMKAGGGIYEAWLQEHQPNCEKNYVGTSGGMEKEAAVVMWSRSIAKHGLRYISMVSDGDSKTISEIHKADPYDGIMTERHECVNHVGKRMAKQLRNRVKECSKQKPKVTLGGKGYGKLRPDVITKLQKYFTNAIRNNSTVPDMQNAILATLDHCSSTDDEPRHGRCPQGEDSWCFFQRAISNGVPTEHFHHADEISTPLCQLVVDKIQGIYTTMSDEKLLRKCLLQTTQNANEAIHSVIWARCPKHLFATKKRVEIATAVGIGEFNFGSQSTKDYMCALHLPVGEQTVKFGQKRDSTRVYKADLACTTQAKRYRACKAVAKEQAEERLRDIFGEFYAAGERVTVFSENVLTFRNILV